MCCVFLPASVDVVTAQALSRCAMSCSRSWDHLVCTSCSVTPNRLWTASMTMSRLSICTSVKKRSRPASLPLWPSAGHTAPPPVLRAVPCRAPRPPAHGKVPFSCPGLGHLSGTLDTHYAQRSTRVGGDGLRVHHTDLEGGVLIGSRLIPLVKRVFCSMGGDPRSEPTPQWSACMHWMSLSPNSALMLPPCKSSIIITVAVYDFDAVALSSNKDRCRASIHTF